MPANNTPTVKRISRNTCLFPATERQTYPDGSETDQESDDIGQHVVGIADKCQRVGRVANDDFNEEEG